MKISRTPVPDVEGPYTVLTAVVPTGSIGEAVHAIESIVARWSKSGDPETAFTPPFPRNHGPKDAWQLPDWTAADMPALTWALRDMHPEQVAVIAALVEADGKYRSTTELLDAAGYPEGTKASGVFRSIAGRCRAVGRKPWWDGAPGDGDGRLLAIDRGDVRALITEAMEQLS